MPRTMAVPTCLAIVEVMVPVADLMIFSVMESGARAAARSARSRSFSAAISSAAFFLSSAALSLSSAAFFASSARAPAFLVRSS